uniref:Retrovirus-related Pol polyprotein from transposon TNT 1-94 n=1 Tax=Tanacetum cinerariifolium TaxID=118510 RepID=A0A699H4Z3_TANCI|nr:retrovirus-related Pol polyprotein from transposon TNT 1-94 [Tanacetum cinerariifolium]
MFRVNRIEDRGTMHEVQVQLVMGELRTELGMLIQNSKYFKDKMLLMQAQENGVALDEEQLLFIACGQDNVGDDVVDEQPIQDLAINLDNMFQADECDTFDYDVDEVPTAQTMFVANLLFVDPVYDEAGPSYDSEILSEVHDRDHYQDAACKHHEEYEMHDDVQPTYVVDSHADYTRDNDMIPYDQYINDNAMPVVQNNVSFVPNDAYMMILNDMHEQPDQYVFGTIQNTVVNKSLTAELTIYKEQPALYNGHEISKTNHVPAIVHNSEETLEIAEITRKKINERMNDLECVKKKVKIPPHDYSKENHLATFAPQKQLTPEQIFWSKDLIKMKSEALKEHTTASRPMKALMVYAIDMEPISPRIRNNREAHLDYLKHLKESVETLHEIVEEAKVERPLDKSLASACLYTKHS